MTKEQIIDVCNSYLKNFNDYKSIQNNMAVSESERISHCIWMIEQIPIHLENGKIEKVMRWLGFIQGVLWSYDKYSIEEMKNHNR